MTPKSYRQRHRRSISEPSAPTVVTRPTAMGLQCGIPVLSASTMFYLVKLVSSALMVILGPLFLVIGIGKPHLVPIVLGAMMLWAGLRFLLTPPR